MNFLKTLQNFWELKKYSKKWKRILNLSRKNVKNIKFVKHLEYRNCDKVYGMAYFETKNIAIAKDTWENDPQNREQTIAHELLHFYMDKHYGDRDINHNHSIWLHYCRKYNIDPGIEP